MPHTSAAHAGLRMSALTLILAVLCVQVHDGGPLTGADVPVTSWAVGNRSAVLDHAALLVTDLGSPVATVALAVICGLALAWHRRSAIPAVLVVGTVGAATTASTALKLVVERSRPALDLQEVLETDYSFPSGHVTGTVALLGITAAILLGRRRRLVRVCGGAVVGCGVVIVAATRVYLGVHWLTDVVAGAILGAVFVTVGAATYGRVHPPVGTPAPSKPLPAVDRVGG
ncbi:MULTISPECIES: phosphatase PAP2 family protein [unclassified Rhodococcus (in: high G+C Gram-positive bacteria)]|uniref:phosphatase PAP2 family protein n=1 Tax=unclassified Rhodococcus (in: high G+C Gram-positive bacteria) TaxID=192944 RepID=UPI00077ADEEB|nr:MULTISPECIES: phosphatase PAP2 family protein [unclassified Rhodococcus (in: high G+C Gram-positive bacteria)]KXX59357.1 phosphatidic acid phosphatase [Rhodococcus sp. LB1]PBC45485.1 phosphatase PAP2 family protein [Rhodococcus sp. ACPA1]